MKRYVVGLVFDNEMNHVLMLKRVKAPFENLYNGVGGKIEQLESPRETMIRELKEETGITIPSLKRLHGLLTLQFPGMVLYAFAIVLKENKNHIEFEKDTREGKLEWLSIQEDNLLDASNPLMAGDGNIAYFIQLALLTERKSNVNYTNQ